MDIDAKVCEQRSKHVGGTPDLVLTPIDPYEDPKFIGLIWGFCLFFFLFLWGVGVVVVGWGGGRWG